ncbi:MAG: 16S rRNA (uracil(1498)-N(3))-methyltransferase [Magnetococcales bacterium]|nr:16S rRNA (uracil(1498)-N(3))-methyltransferase [Magnetococcales bacterium]
MAAIPRLYWPENLQENLTICPDQNIERYLVKILRLTTGAQLRLFNGQQSGEWDTVIQSHTPLQLRTVAFRPRATESLLQITVVLCICKMDALETAVQKLTELGVQRLLLLHCQRSSSHGAADLNENRLQRLLRIAIEAAEQSERVSVPQIVLVNRWLHLNEYLADGDRLLLKERGDGVPSIAEVLKKSSNITLLIGPEGGFTEQELNHATCSWRFVAVQLGPRILRCETAVLVSVSICQMIGGDFG